MSVVLGVLFLAIVVGIATYVVGTPTAPFVAFDRSALEVIQKVLWWINRLSPIGPAGLIGQAAATYGFEALRPLATFSIMVYVGCATVLFVVYPLLRVE